MPSFLELLETHSALDAVFQEHQYALLHFDFALALKILQEYRSLLEAHMADEENLLLPLHGERADIGKDGGKHLFLFEHEKMRRRLKLFIEATESLFTEKYPEAVILRLLDREAFYNRLCSHHDIRETRILYPELDKVTNETERTEIFGRLIAARAVTMPCPTVSNTAVETDLHQE
ncbi:MAG: hypothetical protein KF855_16415 [Acidobacteria bacterium]|nr:hypothetical protein [Acidobacteriota bacterium]